MDVQNLQCRSIGLVVYAPTFSFLCNCFTKANRKTKTLVNQKLKNLKTKVFSPIIEERGGNNTTIQCRKQICWKQIAVITAAPSLFSQTPVFYQLQQMILFGQHKSAGFDCLGGIIVIWGVGWTCGVRMNL